MRSQYHYDAAILCGGESRRMGRDKAFLPVRGRALIENQIEVLKGIFGRVLLVSRRQELYNHLGLEVIPDANTGRGAMVGIYSGLLAARGQGGFFVACDMPFLNEALIRHMVSVSVGHDVVIPQSAEGLEPTHAIYSKSCLPHMKSQMDRGDFKIIRFFPQVRVRVVSDVEVREVAPSGTALLNVNNQAEYAKYCLEGA